MAGRKYILICLIYICSNIWIVELSDCGDNTYFDAWDSLCLPCPETCAGPCDNWGACEACQDGFYGEECGTRCPSHCSTCDQIFGHCTACQDGFYEEECGTRCPSHCSTCDQIFGHCTVCPKGYYGSSCTEHCQYTCRNNTCDIESGKCSACEDGFFGPTCAECPENCLSSICDFSGNCKDCNDGFYGPTCVNCPENCLSGTCEFSGRCRVYCPKGYYGSSCTEHCQYTCRNNTCDIESGKCSGGCLDGRYGNKCELSCSENCTKCAQDGGRCLVCIDGSSCERTCGNCEDTRCDITTGNCEKCQQDWAGQRCDVRVCPKGYYGSSCTEHCQYTCRNNTCDIESGKCSACEDGFFGPTCAECPENCLSSICDFSGNCKDCNDGFYGPTCVNCPENCLSGTCEFSGRCRVCPKGYYGSSCTEHCQYTCRNNTCDIESGKCSACEDGFFGPTCAECPENCLSSICDFSGNCKDCNDGFYGPTCVKCPENCLSGTCEFSGRCRGGCLDGRYGNKCELSCSENCTKCAQDGGKCLVCIDGSSCERTCGNCEDTRCDITTGNCEKCQQDWAGQRCDVRVCPKGYYGSSCTEHCQYTCRNNTCDIESGKCSACEDGFFGPTCAECPENCLSSICDFSGNCKDCNDGFYGPTCVKCPENCLSGTCDVSGRCRVCIDGKYGSSCERTCGNCEDTRCDITTGNCEKCQQDWAGQRCDVRADKQSAGEGSNVGTYAGAGSAGVAVLLIVIIVIVIIVKRRSTTPGKLENEASVLYENPNPTDPTEEHVYLEIENERVQDNANDHENVYYNEGPLGYSVDKLKTMITEKMAGDAKQFVSEFQTLPLGAAHPHTSSERNISKNRYKTLPPYDHSRVVLDEIPGENGSDYINASYIDNVESKKLYVATQGPLPNTTDDFWRMVWFLNSGKIVMLTNLVENRKSKCDKYWPDEGNPMMTKTFNISLNKEQVYASYVVRSLTVVDRKSKGRREVQQFHFTTWPDHGTPDTLELALFHRRVALQKSVLPGQMVVHCSAGVGRTGIFIAIDALLEFGKKQNLIDIRRFIQTMSKDRLNMIQTADQYVALHEVLAESFDLQESLIPKPLFAAKYQALSATGQAAHNQTQLSNEFKLLWDQKPDYKLEKDFQASLLPENRTKNREMRILTADRYRATLKSRTSNGNDYINAVITQSYTDKQGYIVTQFPLAATGADFWTLVMDYQSDTVVILGDIRQMTPWIPDDKADVNINELKVKHSGSSTNVNGVDVIDVVIKRKDTKAAHRLRVFHMKDWTMEIPPSKQAILHLLDQVESRRRSSGNKPVVVTCTDGSTQCGLFCLMANTRDQLKIDEEVDVFQAARQLLIRRPEFLSSFDQYQFCYAILKDYLDVSGDYTYIL